MEDWRNIFKDIIGPCLLNNQIKIIESIRSKYPEMGYREQSALSVYTVIYYILEDLRSKSNATETTFVNDLQILCKDKIEYYENANYFLDEP